MQDDLWAKLLKRLTTSGLADSLATITGGDPPQYDVLRTSYDNLLAHFIPQKDLIEISPAGILGRSLHPGAEHDPSAWTLSHEMGHRLQLRDEPRDKNGWSRMDGSPESLRNPSYNKMSNGVFQQFIDQVKNQPDSVQERFLKRGVSSNLELESEAFAAGIDFFRQYNPKQVTMEKIFENVDKREKQTPGATFGIQFLLEHPLYANHPVSKYLKNRQLMNGMPAAAQSSTKVAR